MGSEHIRVVHTVASLERRGGGLSRVVAGLADALAEQDCDVSVVCLGDAGSTDAIALRRARGHAAKALNIGSRNIWSRQFGALLADTLGAGGPRLVHDHGLWGFTNLAAARAAHKFRVPLIISPHGMLEPWAMNHRGRRKRLALVAYQRAILDSAAMIVVSAASEARAVRAAGLRQPVAIVPSGVELHQITATHGVDAQVRRMLFLSRIHPVKGLVPLIEAWDQIRPAGWEVIVAGPDEDGHRSELERLLIRKRLQSSFRFVGAADDARKAQLFADADLFVLPSFSENFGLVVAEALSCGVPVLTTRGAPWEVLTRIGAGWWVDAGVAGLAQGLRLALATSPAERCRMGLAGQAYVREHLSWQDTARKTIRAYRWCLGFDSGIPDHLQLD